MPADASASPAAVAGLGEQFHSAAAAFADVAERAVANGAGRIASRDLELVLTAAIKLYAAKAEAEAQFPPPVAAERITPTEIVLVVSELLRAADISLFDLAMWYRRGAKS